MGVRGTRVQCINNQFIDVNTLDHRIPSRGVEIWLVTRGNTCVYFRLNASQITRLCNALDDVVHRKKTRIVLQYSDVESIEIVMHYNDTITIRGYGQAKPDRCRLVKRALCVSIPNAQSAIKALASMRDYFVREHQAYLQRLEARKRVYCRFRERK